LSLVLLSARTVACFVSAAKHHQRVNIVDVVAVVVIVVVVAAAAAAVELCGILVPGSDT